MIRRDNTANVAISFRGGPLDGDLRVVEYAAPEMRLPGLRKLTVRTEVLYRRVGRWQIGDNPPRWPYLYVREEVVD